MCLGSTNAGWKVAYNLSGSESLDIRCFLLAAFIIKYRKWLSAIKNVMNMNPVHLEGGGSSGSPLFEENIVYGILHGGGPIEHPEVCVFNSASFIRRLLHYQDR